MEAGVALYNDPGGAERRTSVGDAVPSPSARRGSEPVLPRVGEARYNQRVLESLTIENFRGFEKLELTGLRRVNLIVGKNNTGKTTLLEALHAVGDPASVLSSPFRQGGANSDYRPWVARDGQALARITAKDSLAGVRSVQFGKRESAEMQPHDDWGLNASDSWAVLSRPPNEPLKMLLETVFQRSPAGIVAAVADVIREPNDERRFVEVLKAVDARVIDVRIDLDNSGPFVALHVGLERRIPIWHLGQGVFRLAGLFGLLFSQKPSLCFIDEIENGLHYSAHASVWKGLAEVAAQLDIQVFATTHSRECLQAAHEVFEERAALGEAYELGVIQLYRTDAGVTGRVLQEKHLDAAVTSDIELR